jgi:Xaa-Pro aminopeptidase
MISERLATLRQRMAEQDLPALLVTQPLNRLYMSGFSGSAGSLFITQDQALLLADFRYVERATQEAPDYQVMRAKAGSFVDTLSGLLSDAGVDKVGFESAHVTQADYAAWADKLTAATLVPTKGLVEGLRMVKSADELALIRQAVRVSDGAYDHLKRTIRPGMTEKQVAWDLEVWMRTHGADGIAFSIIVASGPNGAMPHASASDREIQEGESITVDMGATVRGYNSDMTRTFCLGHADDQFHKVYDVVLEAQETTERNLKPGVSGKDGDAFARNVIAAAGYGEQFGHGLGHGVGLAVHEGPGMGLLSTDTLAPWHVATVEPGIYIPGWGGVRIEDMVLITEDGAEVLTQAEKDRVVQIRI